MKKPNKPLLPANTSLQSSGAKVAVHAETYSGPLPKPDALQEYDRIVPGAAERILRMAEKQAEHRQYLEKTVIVGDTKRANWGLAAGFIVAMSGLGAAVWLVATGNAVAGTIIGSADIVGLASVFVYGTVSRRAERTQKAALMSPPSAR